MRRRRSLKRASKTPNVQAKLVDMMKIGLLVHQDGVIWAFHEKPFIDPLHYVEYDGDEKKIFFIGKKGTSVELGLPVNSQQEEHLLNCEFLMAAHVENEDVKDMTMVPVVVRKMNLEEE